MFQEEYNHIISNLKNLSETDVADVRVIAERYPFCQTAQILYAKKLYEINSPLFDNQLKKAAIAAYDRNVLQALIEKMPLAAQVAAGFDEEVHLTVAEEQIVEDLINIPEKELPEIIAEEIMENQVEETIVQNENTGNEEDEENKVDEVIQDEVVQEIMQGIPELQQDDIMNEEPAAIEEEVAFDPQLEVNEETVLDEILELQNDQSVLEEEIQQEEIIQEAGIESIPELEEEIAIVEPEIISEEIFHDPQLEVNEEIALDEFLELQYDKSALEDNVHDEQIVQEAEIESIPELEEIPEMPDEIGQPAEDTSIEPQQEIMEEFVVDQHIEEEMEIDEAIHPEIESIEELNEIELPIEEQEEETPVFDLPGYDIERELGTLQEEDKIIISVRPPVPGEQVEPEEVFEDSFVGWLNRLGSPTSGKVVEMKKSNRPVRIGANMENQPEKPVAEKEVNETVAADLAKKSLEFDDQLVTETYARILVMQGKYQRAIQMYDKLSLLKPKKSDYFAALIDQLKKRIK